MVKDPICGMEIDRGQEHSQFDYKGVTNFFCSEACETTFKKLNGLKLEEKTIAGDIERQMAAYNTLKQLAVTVAHYIRNANSVIAAQAQLLSRPAAQEVPQKSVLLIRQQSEKIESIVDALLTLSDIKLQKYVGCEDEAIFDLRFKLEEKLGEKK